MGTRGLKIAKLAEAAEVNLGTVRYYERIGLMPKPVRTKGGHRSYGHEHLQQLIFIRRARDLGFSIEEIRSLLALNGSANPCANVNAIASRHLATIREKRAALAAMERKLSRAIEACPGEGPLCTILDLFDIERERNSSRSGKVVEHLDVETQETD
jgi:MerR family transcriptional regulator, mercuric resistance operon regulatory protein